ncbi:MAG: sigma-70 family RNA polymerase sigma factor [Planctomycetaceae bacterium]
MICTGRAVLAASTVANNFAILSAMDENQKTITRLLQDGDRKGSSEELLPIVYQELRRLAASQLAQETPGQTLQPTALVHEAYLRLVGDNDLKWENRGHFFAAAARSMRQILINRAIQKKTVKHGGHLNRIDLSEDMFLQEPEPDRVIALDEALQRLETMDERKGRIVMLRYFAGLSIEETSSALGISTATVKREWQFARTWLFKEMKKTLSES